MRKEYRNDFDGDLEWENVVSVGYKLFVKEC
jgi:hypothetical protein